MSRATMMTTGMSQRRFTTLMLPKSSRCHSEGLLEAPDGGPHRHLAEVLDHRLGDEPHDLGLDLPEASGDPLAGLGPLLEGPQDERGDLLRAVGLLPEAHGDVLAVHPFRSRSEAEQFLGLQVIQKTCVRARLRVVKLIDDDDVVLNLAPQPGETAGFSPDFAALFVEFNQALSEGRLHSLEDRNASHTTPTEFEEFAAELAHAYAATA